MQKLCNFLIGKYFTNITVNTTSLKPIAIVTGVIVAALGVFGFLVGEQRLWGVLNTDILLDIIRIGLGGLLIYAGWKSEDLSRTAFLIFGVAYFGGFILGLISQTWFGLLPNGVGEMDQLIHLGGGILGIALSLRPARRLSFR